MVKNNMRKIINNKYSLLSALAFLITLVFIAFRARVGFGPILASGLISYISAWKVIGEARRNMSRPSIAAIGYYAMTAAFFLWLLSFTFIEFNVISEGKNSDIRRGENAIVLGAGLKGEEPSVSLSSRLQKASEYLNQNRDLKVIVSGGQGQGEAITEAEAMKRYLIAKGIKEARIIEENKATSTKENLIFSEKILETFHVSHSSNIIVITSDYHAFRTRMLAKSLGLKISVLPSKTPIGVYVSGCIREYFAVVDTYLLNNIHR